MVSAAIEVELNFLRIFIADFGGPGAAQRVLCDGGEGKGQNGGEQNCLGENLHIASPALLSGLDVTASELLPPPSNFAGIDNPPSSSDHIFQQLTGVFFS